MLFTTLLVGDVMVTLDERNLLAFGLNGLSSFIAFDFVAKEEDGIVPITVDGNEEAVAVETVLGIVGGSKIINSSSCTGLPLLLALLLLS